MTKYEYATRDLSKEDSAKAEIERQAQARGQSIAGWRVYVSADHPGLQEHNPDVEHLIVEGYSTQAELAAAGQPPKPDKPKPELRGSITLEPIAKPIAET